MKDFPQPEQPQHSGEIVDLYREVSPELHRLLVGKLGNSEEAEEIAHDAFEKLLRLARMLHESSNFREPEPVRHVS